MFEPVKIPQYAEEPWKDHGDHHDPYEEPWIRLARAVFILSVIDYLDACRYERKHDGRRSPATRLSSEWMVQNVFTRPEEKELIRDIQDKIVSAGPDAIDAAIHRLYKELGWTKNVKKKGGGSDGKKSSV